MSLKERKQKRDKYFEEMDEFYRKKRRMIKVSVSIPSRVLSYFLIVYQICKFCKIILEALFLHMGMEFLKDMFSVSFYGYAVIGIISLMMMNRRAEKNDERGFYVARWNFAVALLFTIITGVVKYLG